MRRFLVLVCLCFVSFTVFAQTQAPPPPKMTWVRYYKVERGRDADFMRLAHDAFKPVLDDLQKRQKVVAWGVAVPLTMNDDPWTHALYIGLPDWSGVEALDQAIDKAQASMTPDAAKRSQQLGMSIIDEHDVILWHLVQSTTTPKMKSKYIVADTYQVKPGRGTDALQLFNEWGKPLFTDLATSGAVDLWGFSTHGVPGAADWTHMVWWFLHDLGDMDTVAAAGNKLDPRTLQGYAVRLRDMTATEGPREQIWRIVEP
jgi:hypothetical protein